MLGVSSGAIAKIWGLAIGIPIVLVLGYLWLNHDSGTTDPRVIDRVQITPIDDYRFHVKNNTSITLKSLTLICSSGGDAQPTVSINSLYPPLKPGYGVDTYFSGQCKLVRINESHQLW